MHKKLLVALFILGFCNRSNAQIEIDRLSFKGFTAFGFGGLLNFAFQVTDADYVTAEIGFSGFSNNGNTVITAPLLAGYRFTIDRSGTGFYLEPNAGYGFAATDIQLPDAQGIYSDAKIAGAAGGLTLGYVMSTFLEVILRQICFRFESRTPLRLEDGNQLINISIK